MRCPEGVSVQALSAMVILTCCLGIAPHVIAAEGAREHAHGLGATALTPAAEGRRAYLRLNCYGCHGINGGGGMGPRLRGMDDNLNEILLRGSDEGMPSFRKWTTTTDRLNLTAYVRSMGTASEPVFTHWWEPYPSR